MALSIFIFILLIFLSHFPSSRKYLLQHDVVLVSSVSSSSSSSNLILHFVFCRQMQSPSSELTTAKSPTISLRLQKPPSSSNPLRFRKLDSTAPIPPSSKLWPELVLVSLSALLTATFLLSPPIQTPPLNGSTPMSSLFIPLPKSSSSPSATRSVSQIQL